MTALDDTRAATPDRVGSAAAATKRAGTAAAKTAGATAARAFTAAASARDTAAGAAKRGAWAATCRLGRGLRYAGPDYIGWVLDYKRLAAYEAAEDTKDPKMMLTAEKERDASVKARKVLSAAVAMGVVAVWSGGSPYVTILWFVITLAVLAMRSPQAAAIPGAAAGLSLLVEVVHGAYQVPDGWFTYGTPTLGVLALMAAARDGHVMPKDLPNVSTTNEIKTDTRQNRIVQALAEAIGLKTDRLDEFTIVGGGLVKVDDIWSEIVIQTPGTVTTEQCEKATAKLAAALGVRASRLVVTEDEAEGVVRIAVASRDQWEDSPTWPLVTADRFSVWRPLPFARDERGRVIDVTLLFTGWLIAAIPRVGKTFALRLLALAFALDPSTDLAVFDFKGGRNFLMLRRLCVAFGHGRDDATVKAFRDHLKGVLDGADAKKEAFNRLPAKLVPDGQLTEAACRAEPILRPRLTVADEVHWATGHEVYGKEIIDLMSQIGKDLPFLGEVLALASQRLDAAETMPTKVREVLSSRFALKLFSTSDSRMVLGDAANGEGFSAARLPKVKGLGILYGADDTSSIDGYVKAKTFKHDDIEAEQIADRSYELRREAGVLPGQLSAAPPVVDFITDMIRASGRESLSSQVVVSRLNEAGWVCVNKQIVHEEDAPDDAERLPVTPLNLARSVSRVARTRQQSSDGYTKHWFLEDLLAGLGDVTHAE